MDWTRINPLAWFGSQKETDDGFGRNSDGEKLKSLVPMPAILPWFDPLQSADETPAMRIAYRQMLRSPVVKAAFLQKIFAIATLKLECHPASKTNQRDGEMAESFKWQITRGLDGGITDLCWNVIAHGCMDGVGVSEKVWDIKQEGRWRGKEYIRCLKPKDVDQDLYLWVDAFRNITSIQGLRYNTGQHFDPRDFIIFQHLPLFGNPGGMSDFRAAYVPFWQLDTVEKLRAMGAEKRAFPVVAGEYPTTGDQSRLQAALTKLRYSNWLAVPRDTKLSVLNIAGESSDYFADFRRDKLEDIFLALQFAFLQSITGGKGQVRGSSEAAKDVSKLTVWWLSQALLKILNSEQNGLIKEFVDRNYRGVSEYPYVTLTHVDVDSLAKLMLIYEKLWDQGWQHDIRHLEETFGVPYCRDKDNTLMTIIELQKAMPGGKPLDRPKKQGDEGDAGAEAA